MHRPDPADPVEVEGLLTGVWPRLATSLRAAAALGVHWSEMSTPFLHVVDNRVVAHAGVMKIPLVVQGQPLDVAGIHGVCTAVNHRGRGYATRAIESAMAYAATQHDTVILHATEPGLYARLGFRPIDQVVFLAELAVTRAPSHAVPLSSHNAGDVARVFEAFRGRVPVSLELGVGEAAELFVLDEILACGQFLRLSWAEDLQAVIAWELREHTLQIYDVVAPELPSLIELVARAPGPVERVEVFFGVDRWKAPRFHTRSLDAPEVMMVRGPFAVPQATVLPPFARC